MTFSEFWEYAEVKNRKELRELRLHRNLLQAFTGQDMRLKMPLPGDFDHLKVHTPDEVEEIKHKLGYNKFMARLDKKANGKGR